MSEAGGLGGDALKDIIDKAVHDAHCLGGDTGIRVHLLEYLVDVNGVAFLPPLPLALLVALRDVFLSLAGFFDGLAASFRCHGKRFRLTARGVEAKCAWATK